MNKLPKYLLLLCLSCDWLFVWNGNSRKYLDLVSYLIKPSFNPPNWVLPVWSALYAMMGVAAGLVWDRIDFEKRGSKESFGVFAFNWH
jgi:tryptophan-rich sensory protein